MADTGDAAEFSDSGLECEMRDGSRCARRTRLGPAPTGPTLRMTQLGASGMRRPQESAGVSEFLRFEGVWIGQKVPSGF